MKDEVKDGLIPLILALGTMLGLCGTFWLLSCHTIPGESRDILFGLCGCLSTNFTSIVSYFFGSSKSAGHQASVISHQSELLAKSTMPAESTIISESQESGGSKSESTISINSNNTKGQ